MTLLEIIARHEAATAPQPIDERIVLAPKGHALVAGYRFVKVLRTLEPVECAEVLATFASELRGVTADLATA